LVGVTISPSALLERERALSLSFSEKGHLDSNTLISYNSCHLTSSTRDDILSPPKTPNPKPHVQNLYPHSPHPHPNPKPHVQTPKSRTYTHTHTHTHNYIYTSSCRHLHLSYSYKKRCRCRSTPLLVGVEENPYTYRFGNSHRHNALLVVLMEDTGWRHQNLQEKERGKVGGTGELRLKVSGFGLSFMV
jgi:hypothetical protein